jgi:hypothetical protein
MNASDGLWTLFAVPGNPCFGCQLAALRAMAARCLGCCTVPVDALARAPGCEPPGGGSNARLCGRGFPLWPRPSRAACWRGQTPPGGRTQRTTWTGNARQPPCCRGRRRRGAG